MKTILLFFRSYAESIGRLLVGLVHTAFWRFYPFSVERLIARDVRSDDAVCDFGCGDGQLIPRLTMIKQCAFKRVVGCDIHLPYLTCANIKGCYTARVQADLRAIPFKDKSFDVVFCVYMIEHVEKTPRYITHLERLARRYVIITTSKGYSYNPDHGVASQRHLSGYSVDDFEKLGYTVRGIGSRLFINALYRSGRISRYIRPFFSMASILSNCFTYYFPRQADCILCIKRVD